MNEYLIEAFWDRRSKWPCPKSSFTDKNKSRGGGGWKVHAGARWFAQPEGKRYRKPQKKTTAQLHQLLNAPGGLPHVHQHSHLAEALEVEVQTSGNVRWLDYRLLRYFLINRWVVGSKVRLSHGVEKSHFLCPLDLLLGAGPSGVRYV